VQLHAAAASVTAGARGAEFFKEPAQPHWRDQVLHLPLQSGGCRQHYFFMTTESEIFPGCQNVSESKRQREQQKKIDDNPDNADPAFPLQHPLPSESEANQTTDDQKNNLLSRESYFPLRLE